MQGLDTWLVPNGPEATAKLSEAFFRLTDYPVEDRAHVPTEELDVGGGRTLHVPKSLKGVAVFSFKRLCGEARGAADYLAIAQRFHTVIIVGIPVLTREKRNEAARFVTLIDALYEHRVKLLAAADAEPVDLYPAGDGRFEFDRTVSRLEEMQSADYLGEGPRRCTRIDARAKRLASRRIQGRLTMRRLAAACLLAAVDRGRCRQSGARRLEARPGVAGAGEGDVQDRDRNPDRRRARADAEDGRLRRRRTQEGRLGRQRHPHHAP